MHVNGVMTMVKNSKTSLMNSQLQHQSMTFLLLAQQVPKRWNHWLAPFPFCYSIFAFLINMHLMFLKLEFLEFDTHRNSMTQ